MQRSIEHGDDIMKLRLVNIKAEGRKIILFARDENGNKHRIEITDFYPYYYSKTVPKSEHVVKVEEGFVTNKGEEVYKIYVDHPGVVPKLRRDDDYEADIPYVRRFMIDTGLRSWFEWDGSNSWKSIKPIEVNE